MPRLLAIRLSALGDVIHTVPAVTELRSAFDVSWVVEAAYAELVQIVAAVNVIPVRLKKWSWAEIAGARRAVRDFDVAVDFQGLIKSALLARSAASLRYGFTSDLVREKPAALFYNRHIEVDRAKHVVDWNLQLAQSLPGNRRPVTGNWKAFPQDAQNKLSAFTNKIVLLPASGRPEKQWPVTRYRELAGRYGDRAMVVAGPGERALADQIGGLVAPETNLREVAFILQHAQVVIGGDTGPLHLADALGTRVVGLYGPTDPARNGPYGQLHHTIRRSNSMESIPADEVIRKIEEVLEE